MDSSRGCPVACCGRVLAIAALLLVPVAAAVAFAPWQMPAVDGQVSVAAQDAAGFNVVEPAPVAQQRVDGDNAPVERQARDWSFTDGPRPSSNR